MLGCIKMCKVLSIQMHFSDCTFFHSYKIEMVLGFINKALINVINYFILLKIVEKDG